MWKRFLCRFGWHSWTPWDKPRRIEGADGMHQFRACSVCNKQQRSSF